MPHLRTASLLGPRGAVSLGGRAQIQTSAWELGWLSRFPDLGPHGLYALLVLILSTQPFFDLIVTSPHWRTIIGAMWVVAFAAGLWLAIQSAGLRWITWSIGALPLLWLVLVVAVLSSAWSLEPSWTLYHVSWMVGTSLVGVAVGYLVPPKILMGVLFWLFAGILLLSLAVELPSLNSAQDWLGRTSTFQDGIYRWRGTTPNPNYLGPIAASASVFFLVALLFHRLDSRLTLSMFALAAVITFTTRSATSITMLVTGVAMVLSFHFAKRLRLGGDLASLLIVFGLGAFAAIGLVHWERTTSLLNKDTTASMRTTTWEDAINIVEYRPISGHGYGVVWGLGRHSFFPEFETTTRVAHAHNGYLQIATQLGLPAMALTSALILHTLVRGVTAYIRWYSAFALFSTIYVTMFAVGNMTEARLFEPGQFDWLLFVTLATALARANSSEPVPPAGRRARRSATRAEVSR